MEHAVRDVEKHLPVHQKVTGVGIDRQIHLFGPLQLFFVIRRNHDHSVDLALVKQLFRLFETGRLISHAQVRRRIERTDYLTARRGLAVIDDCDRNVAQHLVLIGERIGRRIDQDRSDHDQQHPAVVKNIMVFVTQDIDELPVFYFEFR